MKITQFNSKIIGNIPYILKWVSHMHLHGKKFLITDEKNATWHIKRISFWTFLCTCAHRLYERTLYALDVFKLMRTLLYSYRIWIFCVCCKCFFLCSLGVGTPNICKKKHSENDKRPVQHINRAIFTFYIYREWKMHQYLNAAKLGQHINFWVHNFKQQLGKKRRYTLLFFPIISWKINILMKQTISNETKPNSECFDWWFRAHSLRKQYTHMGKMRHIHWKSNP